MLKSHNYVIQIEMEVIRLEKLGTGFQKRNYARNIWRSRTDSKEAKGRKERESAVGTGSLCPERGDAEQKRNTT